MINLGQLDKLIITPVLESLDLLSDSARVLLIGTCDIESKRGTFVKQVGGGPALGIYQMEPATHDDIWKNFLVYKLDLSKKLDAISYTRSDKGPHPEASEMITNLAYATAMCRVHYARVKEALPAANDAAGMAAYHKKYYNTIKGKTNPNESIMIFKQIIQELGV